MVSAPRPKKLRPSKKEKKVNLGIGPDFSPKLEATDGATEPGLKNSVKQPTDRYEDINISRALQEAIDNQDRLELRFISLAERESKRLTETLSILKGTETHASELQEELSRERERNASLDEQKRLQAEQLHNSQKHAESLQERLADTEARAAQVSELWEELDRERKRTADLEEQRRLEAEQLQNAQQVAELLQARLADSEARAAQVSALQEVLLRERERNASLDEQKRLQTEQLQNAQQFAELLQARLADSEAGAAQVSALQEELSREREQNASLDEQKRLQTEQLQSAQQFAELLQARLADSEARAAQVSELREELDRERKRTADLDEQKRLQAEQARNAQHFAELLQARLALSEARAAHANQLQEELEREYGRNAILDQDLRAAKQRSARLGSVARRTEAELAAKSEEIYKNVEALAEERRRSSALLEELDEIDSKLSDEKNRNADLQRTLSETNDAVRSEREAQARLHSQLSRELQRIAELEDDLQFRSHEFDAALAALSAERDSSLADRTRLIGQLDETQEREKREKKRASILEQEIEIHRAYHDELRTRAERAEAQLTEFAAAVKAERATVERLELEIGALRQKLSDPFVSSLLAGKKSVRTLVRIALLQKKMTHPLFDSRYYLENYPDVREADLDPFLHYLRFGAPEGRNPNRMFDTKWYLEQYSDVRSAGTNPLIHYFSFGASEGRDPHPLFSTNRYVEQHPELEGNRSEALAHYLQTNDAHNIG